MLSVCKLAKFDLLLPIRSAFMGVLDAVQRERCHLCVLVQYWKLTGFIAKFETLDPLPHAPSLNLATPWQNH